MGKRHKHIWKEDGSSASSVLSLHSTAEQIQCMSANRIGATTKPELQAMLSLFERALEQRAPKAQVVAAVNKLNDDIWAGTVAIDGTPDDVMTND